MQQQALRSLTMDEDNESEALRWLRARVQSLPTDPLHSHAHLKGLIKFLDPTSSLRRGSKSAWRGVSTVHQQFSFFYTYDLSLGTASPPTSFEEPADLKQHLDSSKTWTQQSRLIVLTGHPSPEWLRFLIAKRLIDHQFAHRHLDFLARGRRDFFTTPNIPSRSARFIRITIPSILFIEPEARSLSAEELHKARIECLDRLKSWTTKATSTESAQAGKSIVRDIHIHNGDTVVLEQVVTIQLDHKDGLDTVSVWSDAGQDAKGDYLCLRRLPSFRDIASDMSFCPVFFENEATQKAPGPVPNVPNQPDQPLALLAMRFGETLDWHPLAQDSFLMLHELFSFQCASTLQYFNMLRKHISQLQHEIHSVGDPGLKLEDIAKFEYTKTVLLRWCARIRELTKHMDPSLPNGPIPKGSTSETREAMLRSYLRDLAYLEQEATALMDLCESGKSTLLSNFSILEAKRAGHEAKLVTQLTKATNRITYIFLPISFVTSVFGMNFRQFGQGTLSIWIWVGVALPLLVICVLLVQWGGYLHTGLRKLQCWNQSN